MKPIDAARLDELAHFLKSLPEDDPVCRLALPAWSSETSAEAPNVVQTTVTVSDFNALISLARRGMKMEEALEIIAGKRSCTDNLLGDKDIARIALEDRT